MASFANAIGATRWHVSVRKLHISDSKIYVLSVNNNMFLVGTPCFYYEIYVSVLE